MNPVWYVHGANSTPVSFNYIRHRLPDHTYREIAYNHRGPVMHVVDALVEAVEASPTPVTLVGHSLGGVIAVAAAQRSAKVDKVCTIASPLGGSKVASLMRWIAPSQLLEDIHPYAPLISQVRNGRLKVPTMSIVTIAGHNNMIAGENDGVVTVDSQEAIIGPVYIRLRMNHFEVLLSDDAVDLVSGFLFN